MQQTLNFKLNLQTNLGGQLFLHRPSTLEQALVAEQQDLSNTHGLEQE
jgi:hypothetical protein